MASTSRISTYECGWDDLGFAIVAGEVETEFVRRRGVSYGVATRFTNMDEILRRRRKLPEDGFATGCQELTCRRRKLIPMHSGFSAYLSAPGFILANMQELLY